jgi:hypothetical protein
MARRKTKTVTRTVVAKASPPTIRIAAPAPIQRYRKTARKHYRKARAGVGKFFGATQPQLTAIVASGIFGLMQKNGVKVPKVIDSMSAVANAGLLCFAGGKAFKSATLDHAATGLLSIALWAYASDTTISGDDANGYVMGTGVVYGDDDVYGYEQTG